MPNLIVHLSSNVADSREKCPECGKSFIVTLGNQKVCSSCGHQWPPLPNVQRGLSRNAALNGGSPSRPARIIRWNTLGR
jgi:rRNA maturation endonuclease Nob1